MAGTFSTLQTAIIEKLETISDIQEVARGPRSTPEFTGYPAVVVYPTTQESDYQTTAQNQRSYIFTCAVFYEFQNTNVADAVTALYEVVDQVIDAFDQDDRLTGISMPVNKMIMGIRPTPSEWAQIEDTQVLVTNVTLNCFVSVDVVF